ncbi:hypothetical protein HHI36_011208 [Cryptolaemus montrouzieri]|uniref:RING-type domain-containing protein n=1 Tax=Cryptolaemus montrouzieri TaxID=559131 RepID=A0ABD2ML27_9CUCU
MGFVEDELTEVRNLCENVVEGSKLVSCVRSMVRVEIERTPFKRIIACFQFPESYPKCAILVELKSKTYSPRLLDRLTDICEQEAKKYIDKAQILIILKFLRNFIDENPLACCYEEINELKSCIGGGDQLKLKQKTSCIIVKVMNQKYYLQSIILIPDDYPEKSIDLQEINTNFPPALNKHITAQAKEIARRCFPDEQCQICKKLCLPKDPALLELDENSPNHIERIYCGHLFHLECLVKFMRTPPFGNKKCSVCGQKISHHKWNLSDRLAENRWAHEQARERELEEVTDFFK